MPSQHAAARRPAARTARAPRRSRRRSPGSSRASPSDGDLGRVGALDGALQLARRRVELGVAAPRPGELARPAAEQGEVARADRPARPGEQREQRGVGGEVVEQVERRDHLGHLGQPEQALEADDLDRDLARGQRVEDVGGVGVVAGEHADLATSAARPSRAWRRRHLLGQPGELVGVGLVHDRVAPRPSPRVRLRPRAARPRRARRTAGRRARWRPRGSGASERRLTVSGYVGTSAPVGAREVAAEVEDVGDRRAAPAVDRLVGVADRGHRVAEPVAGVGPGEQRAAASAPARPRCPGTRRAARPGTCRARPRRPRAARRPAGRRARSGRRSPSARAARLSRAVGLDQPEQLGALGRSRRAPSSIVALGLADASASAASKRGRSRGVEGAHVVGVDEVLAHLRRRARGGTRSTWSGWSVSCSTGAGVAAAIARAASW